MIVGKTLFLSEFRGVACTCPTELLWKTSEERWPACLETGEMLYICEVLLSPRAAAAAVAVVIKIAAIKQGNTP